MSGIVLSRRFARTCSRCSRPPICSRPRRTALPPARRSTRPSTTRPTSSPRQALDNRASDINNLLDGIGNGVQVLQAANTGITSLQKLVDTAKSIANQALQSAVGYSTKSNVSTTIAGATATDLRGTTTYTSATAASNVLYSGAAGGTTAATSATTLGGIVGTLTGAARQRTTRRHRGQHCRQHADPAPVRAAPSTISGQRRVADGDVSDRQRPDHHRSRPVPLPAAARLRPARRHRQHRHRRQRQLDRLSRRRRDARRRQRSAICSSAIDLASGVADATLAGAATSPTRGQTAVFDHRRRVSP